MVRTIDAEGRRRALSEAVWRIIRRDGFDATSVRAVAAETGLSVGSVRHFFATQDELHVFAMEELIRDISERATFAARTGQAWNDRDRSTPSSTQLSPTPPSERQRARAGLRELLPLTSETEELYRAHLHFVLRASVSPVLAPVAQRTFDELQTFYEQVLSMLTGRDAADLGPLPHELATLMDGVTFRRIVTPHLLDACAAEDLLDDFLDRATDRSTPKETTR